MSLEKFISKELSEKIQNIRKGYSFSGWSLGFSMYSLILGEEFGVKFDEDELKTMWQLVLEKKENDFKECIFPAFNTISTIFYKSPLNISFESFDKLPKLKTEYELMKEVAKQSKEDLKKIGEIDPIAKDNIEKILKNEEKNEINNNPFSSEKINIVHINPNLLKELNKTNTYIPLDFYFRNKTEVSEIRKLLKKYHEIINPTKEQLDKIFNSNNLTLNNYREEAFIVMKKFSENGSDYYKDREKIQINKNFNEDEFLKILDKIFYIDGQGLTINGKNNDLDSLINFIEDEKGLGFYLPVIKSRVKKNLSTFEQDGANVYPIRGIYSEGASGELRIQTCLYKTIGILGKKSHGLTYKPNAIKKLTKNWEKSEKLQKAQETLTIASGITKEDIFKYGSQSFL